MSMCEICSDWCRPIVEKRKITNHHPDCPHYNDSLIDVFRVSDGEYGFVTLSETQANECLRDSKEEGISDLKITKEKMHKEVFDQLPEFEGF